MASKSIIETKGRRDYNDIGGTNMAITSMMFSSSEHAYPQSTFIAILEGPTSGHIRKNSPFSSKPYSTIGSLVGFWKSLASKAFQTSGLAGVVNGKLIPFHVL